MFKKNIYLRFLLVLLLFINCNPEQNETQNNDVVVATTELFNINDLPEIKLTVPLKDWNKLLTNYDLNNDNDKKVVSHFEFNLNGQKITLDSIGIRLRGNTSRRRPEGNLGELHNATTPDWHHCHFGLNFDKFKNNQKFNGLEKLNLKWFKDDANYAREIYTYDLFERFGIWTAPQASYCKLTIYVEGDAKPAYYGVYAMIESVDEDFIAKRNAQWGGNVGYLWKAGWAGTINANFVQTSSMGVQDISIDPSKRGTFKAQATRMDMGIQEAASHILANKEQYSPEMVKKANFAKNFAKEQGGDVHDFGAYLSHYTQGGDMDEYAEGGEYELTESQIRQILANGGEIEFL